MDGRGLGEFLSTDVLWIGAGTAFVADQVMGAVASPPAVKYTCAGPVQHRLWYNISSLFASLYLPFRAMPGETLGDEFCCDAQLESFAEPPNLFARPDVALFQHMAAEIPTTFYDPVCLLPLSSAPVNRSLADFRADTTEHTCPSFCAAEAITENIVVCADGRALSKCGTHLGDYTPDEKEPRYCVDLVCISGQPTG